jgi:hypothetical protein
VTPGTHMISDIENNNGSDEGHEVIIKIRFRRLSNKFVWKNMDSFPASMRDIS